MRFSFILGCALVGGVFAQASAADPTPVSCRFLDVLGSNRSIAIEPLIEDVASTWRIEARENASDSLGRLSENIGFQGGNVYRLTSLGDDLTEDLVLLRLKDGEVHGLLLRYAWAPEGTRLIGLDYKQNVEELSPLALSASPQKIACPS